MATMNRSFDYDTVLSLNASRRVRECLPAIEQSLGERRMLAATLNHRFFNLYEKNFIKGTIEAHNLDHLMFSIRPSSQRFIAQRDEIEIAKFRDVSQVIFVLQVMARYEIQEAIVQAECLLTGVHRDSVQVWELEPQIAEFLNDLEHAWQGRQSVRKQFPWLFTVTELMPRLRDRELILFDRFATEEIGNDREYDDYQITNLEKDLFWVGFDAAYKQAPHDKEYPATKWTVLVGQSKTGRGLFDSQLRYCTRCCIPESMEGITLDEVGICVPCRSSEEKMHIDWEQRRRNLHALVDSYRSDEYYDCMFPMSGGKDSTFQGHLLEKVLKVTSLAVSHGTNWMSLAGRYNLENCLQKFDLDHMFFVMNRAVINRVARKSLAAIGDACWHCHIGVGTFCVQTGLAWKTDLMCWGESIAEQDGRGSYHTQTEASLFYNLEVSARVKAEDMADAQTTPRDVSPWMYASPEQLKSSGMRYIHLGNYYFWDEERQVEFIKRNYEWMESPVENTYKGYKSVECVMAGVHDYANFIKRGIGRATVHAAQDVRRGLLTREEGFELAKKFDTQRPHALDYYLQLTGMTEEEFEQTLREARRKSEYASKLNV